jgi:hypothetical protein
MPAFTELAHTGSLRIQHRLISVLQVSILLFVDCQRLQGREETGAGPYGESRHGLSHNRQMPLRLLRPGRAVRPSDPNVSYRR